MKLLYTVMYWWFLIAIVGSLFHYLLRIRRKPMSRNADFHVANEGSIYILTPLSEAARAWVIEHLTYEMTWGGGIVVEHRYIADIVSGIRGDGLTAH